MDVVDIALVLNFLFFNCLFIRLFAHSHLIFPPLWNYVSGALYPYIHCNLDLSLLICIFPQIFFSDFSLCK